MQISDFHGNQFSWAPGYNIRFSVMAMMKLMMNMMLGVTGIHHHLYFPHNFGSFIFRYLKAFKQRNAASSNCTLTKFICKCVCFLCAHALLYVCVCVCVCIKHASYFLIHALWIR